MRSHRDIVVAEVRKLVAETGLTPSALAREAGLATSTLTRFLAHENAALLSTRTMMKLRETRDAILARQSAALSVQSLLTSGYNRALIAELLAMPEKELRAALDQVKRSKPAGRNG